jgi:hypothetical protein
MYITSYCTTLLDLDLHAVGKLNPKTLSTACVRKTYCVLHLNFAKDYSACLEAACVDRIQIRECTRRSLDRATLSPAH